ncbi:MAG: pseudouridylate synthase [Paraprevotella sp.]|nr:pseudouridylate synthase [Paraprevotella sp.]
MVQLLQLLDITPLDILPQRPPFVMIDHLTNYSQEITATQFTVRPDNIFVAEGKMLATGLIENMAQTCAARLGYYNLISGLPVKIGFIGAIRNLHIMRTPKVGETLDTLIRVKEEIFGMTLVDAESRVKEEMIAKAEMKIAIQ